MQDIQSRNQHNKHIHSGKTDSPGNPGSGIADHFPVASPTGHRKSAFTISLIVIFIMVALWLGLVFITGTKLFFITTLTGICVGLIYGQKSNTRINGMIPGMLIFIISVLGSSLINWYLVSVKLKMGYSEMKDHFGQTALLEAILEQYTFWDVLFIAIAVFAASYLAVSINRKRMYNYNLHQK